jgi:hypothetical protein
MSRRPEDHLTDEEFETLMEECADSITSAAAFYYGELRSALHELRELRGRCRCKGTFQCTPCLEEIEADEAENIDELARTSSALEQAARDGEEFHRMQSAVLEFQSSGCPESPGFDPSNGRMAFASGWNEAIRMLISALRDGGLLPS